MQTRRFVIASLFCLIAVGAFAGDDAAKIQKEQTEIRQMAQDTLTRLYKAEPSARTAVHKAYGYAVFSYTGVKILIGGSGHGHGIAIVNKSRGETFMEMFQAQAGLGFGVKKFRVVFVFDNKKAFDGFVNSGWQFGGQADAAAKASPEKGGSMQGAASVSDGVWMYQLTDKGIALEITVTGTKYSKDDDLNKKT